MIWKLVPIGFSLVLLIAAAGAQFRREGTVAGWMLGVLLVLPARSFMALSLIGWGNHYECGVVAVLSLLLATGPLSRGRMVVLGALLMGGVWVGFSALFAVPAAMGWLLVRWMRGQVALRRLLWMLPGLALGALPLIAQVFGTGSSPLGEIYGGGEALPSFSHLPQQLTTLLHPRQIAGLLGAPQLPAASVLSGVSVVVAAGLAVRIGPDLARASLMFIVAWTGIYLLSGFHIPVPPAGQIPTPAALRYFAPLYPLLVILIASVAALQWKHGRRLVAGGLMAGPVLVGLLSRLAIFSGPFPAWPALEMVAADHAFFRQQASYQLSTTAHRACTTEVPGSRALHAYALGRADAEAALAGNPVPDHVLPALQPDRGVFPGAYYEGAASAAIDHLDPSGSGEVPVLERIHAAGWSDGDAGLKAAMLARRHGTAAWLVALEPHDESSLQEISAILSGSPIRAQAWWLVGQRWGEDTGRWLIPTELALPEIAPELEIPVDFAVGLGEAMGEMWGPLERIPCPQNLPATWKEPFLSGYTRGWMKRWQTGPIPQCD